MIRDRNERARKTALIAMSTATHVVLFTGLGLVPSPSEVLARQEMEFEVVEPAKPPPEPEKPIEEPEPERPKPAKPPPAKPAEPEPEPEPAKAEPEADPVPTSDEPVADFTGVTLTAEGGGAGWSTAVGSGAPLRGPVGKIGDKTEGSPAAKQGPRVLAADRLGRRPEPPPGMSDILQRNYPRRARVQGVEGRAALRLRILPGGRIGSIRTVSESPEGWEFAEACRQTVQQAGPWPRPPLGPDGEPVATDVTYTCRFEVY